MVSVFQFLLIYSDKMISFNDLYEDLKDTPLEFWITELQELIGQNFSAKKHGNLPTWLATIDNLPIITPSDILLNTDTITLGQINDCSISTQKNLETTLKKLSPWRKGPFQLFGVTINTEWRSDLKWNRLKDHISPLKDRRVLDIGCGSGYHCWRMLGEEAQLVLGIEPAHLFVAQFNAIKKYVGRCPAHVIPIGVEDLPPRLAWFDSVFSMGVLYHRRSPIQHLLQLKDCLRPGGELILETLVIEGENTHCLVPRGRYACMANVWFIPSTDMLLTWLAKCGMQNIRMVDVSATTTTEQRSTEWMTYHSLVDYLDPSDNCLTVEGHPAPMRAIIIATKP